MFKETKRAERQLNRNRGTKIKRTTHHKNTHKEIELMRDSVMLKYKAEAINFVGDSRQQQQQYCDLK